MWIHCGSFFQSLDSENRSNIGWLEEVELGVLKGFRIGSMLARYIYIWER